MVPRPRPNAAVRFSLPPHLQEVCSLLGTGLIRLREPRQKSSEITCDHGENRLDFAPKQSGHANPGRKGNS